jgi:polyhydroxyalkanoate synthesis regulator phasin
MARGDHENEKDNLMNKLRQMSEEGIAGFFNEIMSNDRMRSSFGRAGERFMANKRTFDRNVEQVLDFVNIPSKRDVRDLKARLDHLSSQLLNLSIKLDRALDHSEGEVSKAKPTKTIRGAKKPG